MKNSPVQSSVFTHISQTLTPEGSAEKGGIDCAHSQSALHKKKDAYVYFSLHKSTIDIRKMLHIAKAGNFFSPLLITLQGLILKPLLFFFPKNNLLSFLQQTLKKKPDLQSSNAYTLSAI